MLIVISPAKTLDYESKVKTKKYTQPDFLEDSAELVKGLSKLGSAKLGKLMNISPKLAELNSERYQDWSLPFSPDNARQCVFTFKGDVYAGLDAETLTASDLTYAQKHLRILSGLYGLLRPLDMTQPYRLEMGTRYKNARGADLYSFWGNQITDALRQTLKGQKDNVLINLASNEYFKSVKAKELDARIITPVFKDKKNGEYKLISFFAKKARGLMSRYIIQNKLKKPEEIKDFNLEGYKFKPSLSKDDQWVFTRDKAPRT